MTTSSLFIPIDPGLTEPLHVQVYRGLRDAIADGRLKQGECLPSTRALAGELRVGRNTVLRAVDRLKAEELVEGRVGSGVRVVRGSAPVRTAVKPVVHEGPDDRPFLSSGPPLDIFPTRTWTRIATRRWRHSTRGIIESADPFGYLPLREVIAEYVRSLRGVNCTANQVLITSGSRHAFEIVLRALLKPGEGVFVEDPGRVEARAAVAAATGRAIPVSVDREGFNPALIARKGGAHVALLAPGCHLPSGVIMPVRRRQQVVEWARATGGWIIEDDHHAETRFVGRPAPTIHAIDGGARTIFVSSFAHVLFPSLRIGFAIVPESIRDRVFAAEDMSEQHAPTGTQAILADFIEAGHYTKHVRRLRNALSERYEAIVHALNVYCGAELDPCPASAGVHLLAWLPRSANENAVISECDRRGVTAYPLAKFRVTPGRPGLVLAFGPWTPPDIVAGVKRLARALTGMRRGVADAITEPVSIARMVTG
jgi:GntR family transcriptional regulator/MocR family aminotransferase